MRSLPYILGGKAGNLDDCLDLFRKGKISKKVELDIFGRELCTELYMANRLTGKYTWEFEDSKVSYEECYGACFIHEKEGRQKISVDNANKRLEKRLEKIGENGIDILGKDKRFDSSVIYKKDLL